MKSAFDLSENNMALVASLDRAICKAGNHAFLPSTVMLPLCELLSSLNNPPSDSLPFLSSGYVAVDAHGFQVGSLTCRSLAQKEADSKNADPDYPPSCKPFTVQAVKVVRTNETS